MSNQQFTQFEDYAEAVIHADLRLKLPRLVRPRWELKTQCVGGIGLQFGKEGSGVIADGSAVQIGYTLFVPLAGLQFANGQPLEDRRMLLMTPGGELAISSKVPHDWCSIVLPFDLLGHDQQSQLCSHTSVSKSQVIDIGSQAAKRLRQLLIELRHVFKAEPTVPTISAANESMQGELLAACKPIIERTNLSTRTMGRPVVNRREVIDLVMSRIESPGGISCSIDELINEVGVSERTLRNIFLKYYGLPPHRFLVVHRLHQARAALRVESPASSKVTTIATRYGFWHLGRFAREYRKLFGESPSQTLSRTNSR
jgi:AraC family ethanolamine operon transcriptional activator